MICISLQKLLKSYKNQKIQSRGIVLRKLLLIGRYLDIEIMQWRKSVRQKGGGATFGHEWYYKKKSPPPLFSPRIWSTISFNVVNIIQQFLFFTE